MPRYLIRTTDAETDRTVKHRHVTASNSAAALWAVLRRRPRPPRLRPHDEGSLTMAKLSAHGPVVARWRTTSDTDVEGETFVYEYTLHRDGYVLRKRKLIPHTGWTGWKVYGRYLHPAEDMVPLLARVLCRKHTTVERIG